MASVDIDPVDIEPVDMDPDDMDPDDIEPVHMAPVLALAIGLAGFLALCLALAVMWWLAM